MDSKPNSRAQAILDELHQSQHQKVKVAFTDINGTLKTCYLKKENFFEAASSHLGTHLDSTLGLSSLARIDLKTFRTVPWESHVPFFIGDFEPNGKNLSCFCPRQVLKQVIERFQKLNYSLIFGLELEWFNFTSTQSPNDSFDYSILKSDLYPQYLDALREGLNSFKIPLEILNANTGPGVLKASIQSADALETADRAILIKTAIKSIANHFGIIPTFMAKWSSQLPGCGTHIHQSLWTSDQSINLFYDEQDPNRMSSLFKSYLAGQMTCLPELLPLFAPTVNSYKRLVEDCWAPSQVNWGIEDKTAAFSILPFDSTRTRLEARITGTDINPYLALAGCLASGLYGIENQLNLITGSRTLPKNLYEAASQMNQSRIASDLFGDAFVKYYVSTRLWEWDLFQKSVTDWELERYFEVV